MATTAFIKPIMTKRGALYSFQSAIDEITLTFNHDNKKFRFSKFALLRIPEMGTPETLDTDNKVQFPAVGETPIKEGVSSTDYNMNLAESFQNYCLNLEAQLLSRGTYDASLRRTVSERAFWKWMKETGAIRFREANILNERDSEVITESRFVEEDEVDSTYNKVVKLVGEIGAINSVKNTNSYTEIYIHVPSNAGTTPRIMFDSIADNNYQEEMRIPNQPEDPLDLEYLSGRHYWESHPYGLRTIAFYDLDDSSVTHEQSEVIGSSPSYVEERWFDDNTPNSYFTDPEFGNPDTLQVRKTIDASQVEYLRSSLDGISIDFDLNNYKLVNDNEGIATFNQFNELVPNESHNFEFNAVLIYYDIFDVPEDPNEDPVVTTNLYGILFMSQVEELGAGTDFFIPTYPKFKPDVINKVNGTAVAFKQNLKFDDSVDNAPTEKSVNDFNTFSMDLYLDAVAGISNLTDSYNNFLADVIDFRNEIDELKDLFINDTNKNELLARIETIESSLINNQSLIEEGNDLMDFVNDLYRKYDDILQNRTTVDVTYNLDPATIASLVPRNQSFNLGLTYEGNILDSPTLELIEYSNYFRHTYTSSLELSSDLSIRIDDTTVQWSRGQTLRLVFDSELDPEVHNINILTDATGIKTGSEYGKTIGLVNSSDFATSDNKPIFDIICVDADNYEFRIDKIR